MIGPYGSGGPAGPEAMALVVTAAAWAAAAANGRAERLGLPHHAEPKQILS